MKRSDWWAIVPLVELYIAITLASVTHRELFLLSPVPLPLLGVPVPPEVLAIAAPALLLATVGGALFLKLRPGARLLLAVVPVLILLQAQLAFLPLHSPGVTWTQRGFVVLGLALAWPVWRSRVAGAAALLFSLGLATFPGEWADEHVGNAALFPQKLNPDRDDWLSPSALLFGRFPGDAWGPFSNTLDLAGQSFAVPAYSALRGAPSLRGRRLEKANFFLADLRDADFSGAFLDGAKFVQADVRGAKFTAAFLREADFGNGGLEGADFSDVHAERTLFNGILPGMNFQRAHLRGAVLSFGVPTHLEGANLAGADLDGTVFETVFLQGADLRGARLAGVTFSTNYTPDSDLGTSRLDGANLDGADLRGADLKGVLFTGASLRGAHVWRTANEPRLDLADATGVDRAAGSPIDVEAIRREAANYPWSDEQARRLATLDPAKPEPADATPASTWTAPAPTGKSLAAFLADLVCQPPSEMVQAWDRSNVARGIMANGRLAATGPDIAIVADRMRAGKDNRSACPGVERFDEKDWAALDALVAKAR
ncbi:MAG TPA: pentapeptide repeat-containing protein [Reyranella sp.]|nr:pentapeptide repeat-containing protein [Reyranella sp.]